MIDHVGLKTSNQAASRRFYEKALAPLGYTVLMEFEEGQVVGMGIGGKPDFWFSSGETSSPIHLAFSASEPRSKRYLSASRSPAAGTRGPLDPPQATAPQRTTAIISAGRRRTTFEKTVITPQCRGTASRRDSHSTSAARPD